MIHWYDIISIMGVAIILVAYFLLQWERLDARSYAFSLLNIIGSLMILYSLLYDWNLSAVLIEISWVCISVVGLLRQYLK